MSKSKISKEDVAAAIRALKADGKNPTMNSLRAALGNQGSMSTIQQFKKELDDAELAAQDSSEALVAFRSIWSLALEEGRRQREGEIQDLQETVATLSTEQKQFEGEATASRTAAESLALKYEDALARATSMNTELAEAKTTSERNATKLLDATEQHHRDQQKLRDQFALSQARVHELELQLVRLETRLEAAIKT